jgi:hypothetical protein
MGLTRFYYLMISVDEILKPNPFGSTINLVKACRVSQACQTAILVCLVS